MSKNNNSFHEVENEKEKTKRELINKVFWFAIWFLIIGGCVATEYISKSR